MTADNPFESPRPAPKHHGDDSLPIAAESHHELATVATFGTAISAETARIALEQVGYQAFVADAMANTSFSVLGGNAVGWIKLQTAARDVEAARAFLESQPGLLWESGHDVPAQADDACLSCGATIPEGRDACPACGWTFDLGTENDVDEIDDEEEDEQML